MSRVLIVCDGDGEPKLCFSPTFVGSPEWREAIELLETGTKAWGSVPTPQSAIDRFEMPGEESCP